MGITLDPSPFPRVEATMSEQADRIRTDVLVIGGGAAGLTAALAARKGGAGVVLVSKGSAGRSGNTPMAEGGIQACFHPADSPARHARDTLAAGHGLGDPRLVAIFTERAPGCVRELEAHGVRLRRQEDGTYFQYVSAGTSEPGASGSRAEARACRSPSCAPPGTPAPGSWTT